MRDYILVYINGKRNEVRGEAVFRSLAEYLRYDQQLTGTKVVCAEGDCGACTLLVADVGAERGDDGRLRYRAINSCITSVHHLDGCSVVTVEGLRDGRELSAVQTALAENHASQCGFCTPGFVCSVTALYDDKDVISAKDVKNYCTGNLCRCTGYKAIIDGALSVDRQKLRRVKDRYHDKSMLTDLLQHQLLPVRITANGRCYDRCVTLAEALALKAQDLDRGIVAGATDLGVLANKNRLKRTKFLSLAGIAELRKIELGPATIEVGAAVNLSALERVLDHQLPEFARYLHLFASPQIKHAATLVGNIANASPIGDTMPPLLVLDARLRIQKVAGRVREVRLADFYKGYKVMDLAPDELITQVILPRLVLYRQVFRVYKVSKRKDLDISTVSAAFFLSLQAGVIEEARIAFGGVGPYPSRIPALEAQVNGLTVSDAANVGLARQVRSHITPIDDLRGSASLRQDLAANLVAKFFAEMTTTAPLAGAVMEAQHV